MLGFDSTQTTLSDQEARSTTTRISRSTTCGRTRHPPQHRPEELTTLDHRRSLPNRTRGYLLISDLRGCFHSGSSRVYHCSAACGEGCEARCCQYFRFTVACEGCYVWLVHVNRLFCGLISCARAPLLCIHHWDNDTTVLFGCIRWSLVCDRCARGFPWKWLSTRIHKVLWGTRVDHSLL